MPPTTPRRLFNYRKIDLIKELGRKALDDVTIDRIGSREFGPYWAGCNPIDRVKFKPNTFQIVNTDPHNKPGTHWLGVYQTRNKVYVFDSYGRKIPSLVSHFISDIKKHGMSLGATNLEPHAEQIGYTSELCGVYSLSWLLVVRDLGIKRASII